MNIFRYLRLRCKVIGAFILFAFVFAIVFALYELPLAAVLYPTLICSFAAFTFSAADYTRLSRRYRVLHKLLDETDALPELLPPAQGQFEEEYQALLRSVCAKRKQDAYGMEKRYADMMEYYTLWAHQIKTPIAAMRLHLQAEDTALNRTLLVELGRVEQYADMVLAYLRLDSESTDWVFREYDLDGIVRQAVKRFAGEFIARKLTLSYEPLHLRVVTDEKWLTFVLEQVLSNALKYTREGGVRIELREQCTLCIADTGIGIAPEDLPRVFEKGYTGLNGRDDQRASGIGLYLCRRVCGQLGHKISAESVLGEGTRILIDLSQEKVQSD